MSVVCGQLFKILEVYTHLQLTTDDKQLTTDNYSCTVFGKFYLGSTKAFLAAMAICTGISTHIGRCSE